MKIIGFHTNQLDRRGSTTVIRDYGFYNESLLKNKTIVFSKRNNNSDPLFEQAVCDQFETYIYTDFAEVESIIHNKKIDVMYFFKSGENDNLLSKYAKNCIHAVFQRKDIHGDVYAYVSEWLSKHMTNGMLPYVPHIVTLPKPNYSYRDKLHIPKNAIVFGRHGGYDQFNIPFVSMVISDIAKSNPNIYFLFVNTEKFIKNNLHNVIFLDAIHDLQEKSNFINSCDAMIHAQRLGETFGLSVCEFLFHGKPVITWSGETKGKLSRSRFNMNTFSKNHLLILGNKGIYYRDYSDLHNILKGFNRLTDSESKCIKELVIPFKPELVMEEFNKVFIK